MFVFGQLNKHDPHLRWVALGIVAGFLVLVVGLWWVQIVSFRDYQSHLEMQSFRTVRIPAVRGKILDRDGQVLAENRPVFNASLFLEELRADFNREYNGLRPTKVVTNVPPLWKRLFESPSVRTQYVRLKKEESNEFKKAARFLVVSNTAWQISARLNQSFSVTQTNFELHYKSQLALPFPVATNLNEKQIAIFEEQFNNSMGLDLEMQSTRVYPHTNVAAHLLGFLQRNDDSVEGEDASFSHRLPDFAGQLGIEAGYDKELRGKAGTKTVLVNNAGYRQTENVWVPAEPGRNVVLALDLHVQERAERALRQFSGTLPGAAVVMDIQTGDVLALASHPTYDPNMFLRRLTKEQVERFYSLEGKPAINRATQGGYAPGSIFKPLIGLAALEAARIDPNATITVPPAKRIVVRGHPFKDLAEPGEYNFYRAIAKSSNTYFITIGLMPGVIQRVVELGQRLHLGERFPLPTHQETAGHFPKPKDLRSGWNDITTGNMSIGQAPVIVTPLQMAVLACALANGGAVLSPRLVDRIEPINPALGQETVKFPARVVRDHLGVPQQYLKILYQAMLEDVEGGGTGKHAQIPGFPICGKTGTAQVEDVHGKLLRHDVWFLSFAPFPNPRYAVVVMVEGGSSGGGDCAPIAREIYEGLRESEALRAARAASLAQMKSE
jgi:penicillin-binding protein 2